MRIAAEAPVRVGVTHGPGDARAAHGVAWRALAITGSLGVPILIGAVFGHAGGRALLPESIMLVFVVVVTLIGGVIPGVVSALSSTASLWFFNLPPEMSFRLTYRRDTAAVILTGFVALGLVFLVARLQRVDRAATARRARVDSDLQVQQRVISTMQRALLPQVVPAARGIAIGSYYQTGGVAAVPVGGDWFAFIPLSPTSLGLAIGDVAGHGLAAVTAMAEYRYAMRVVATQYSDPAEVMHEFEAVTAMYRREVFTTCVYGLLDALEGTWTFSSAGHPPPILVRRGEAELLGTGPHGPAIGIGAADYGSTTESLKNGDLIVMYTDGLIEQRGESIDQGIERLRRRVTTLGADRLDAQCEEIVNDLVGPVSEDDAAILIARYETTLS